MKASISFKTVSTRIIDDGLAIEHSDKPHTLGNVVLVIPSADFSQVLSLLDLATIYRIDNISIMLPVIGLPGRFWVMRRFTDPLWPGWFFGMAQGVEAMGGSFLRIVDGDIHHLAAAIDTGRARWAQDVERTYR